MPTARPSITPSTGVTETISTTPDKRQRAERGDADAEQGGDDGHAGADERAEQDEEHDRGDGHTDELGSADEPGDLHRQAGREVDGDAFDGRRQEGRLDRRRGLLGDLQIGRAEDHRRHGRGPVLGHEADARRELQQGRAGLELLLLRRHGGGAGVELGLLGVELGQPVIDRLLSCLQVCRGGLESGPLGSERVAGRRRRVGRRGSRRELGPLGVELGLGGVDVRLGLLQLGPALVDLGLAAGQELLGRPELGAPVGELLRLGLARGLRGEGVHRLRYPIHGVGAGHGVGDGGLLFGLKGEPSGVVKTTLPLAPAAAGMASARCSVTTAVGVPGMEIWPAGVLPKATKAPAARAKTTSQATTTVSRRAAAIRPMR